MNPRGRKILDALAQSVLACALAIGAWAYFGLCACAPVSTFRPIRQLPLESRNEVGFGGEIQTVTGDLPNGSVGGGGGTIWYAHRWDRFQLGVLAFGNSLTLFGGGLSLRPILIDRDTFQLGLEIEGGWLWVGAGVPVAMRLNDDVWVYSRPSISGQLLRRLQFPIGVDLALDPSLSLVLEIAASAIRAEGQRSGARFLLNGGAAFVVRF